MAWMVDFYRLLPQKMEVNPLKCSVLKCLPNLRSSVAKQRVVKIEKTLDVEKQF